MSFRTPTKCCILDAYESPGFATKTEYLDEEIL